MPFLLFIGFVILLRLVELAVARRNEIWIRQNGAIEYGKDHYPIMVTLHTSFFISMLIEYYWLNNGVFNFYFLISYLMLTLLKIWVISTLGKYWNTKILRIPNVKLVNKGIYKYVKHPNYIIVILEIFIIPLVFHLIYTALLFSILNALMLYVRIKEENKALS